MRVRTSYDEEVERRLDLLVSLMEAAQDLDNEKHKRLLVATLREMQGQIGDFVDWLMPPKARAEKGKTSIS